MSEVDLPERLAKYGGGHVEVKRIALTESQTARLPSFPARDKRKDPRYDWFRFHALPRGDRCWEIDALDPNELRDCVEAAIKDCIRDPEAWERWELVNQAQSDSLCDALWGWVTAQGREM